MKYQDNILQVAALQPDYLGFIFYKKSARNFNTESIPELPNSIKKTGVFVDADLDFVLEKVNKHKLQALQLHGKESPEYCSQLKKENIEIIKVFSIKDAFDFSTLKPYENVCDYFLFDTKGKHPGGNGYTFDWNVLNNYPSTKPFFLSGGLGLNEIEDIKQFTNSKASKYCYALDVNSKFEIEPGLKNIEDLKKFKYKLFSKFDFIAKVTYDGLRKAFVNSGYRPHIEFENINFKTSGAQYFINKSGEIHPNETQIAFISITNGATDLLFKKLYNKMKFNFYEASTYIGKGEITEILNKNLEK